MYMSFADEIDIIRQNYFTDTAYAESVANKIRFNPQYHPTPQDKIDPINCVYFLYQKFLGNDIQDDNQTLLNSTYWNFYRKRDKNISGAICKKASAYLFEVQDEPKKLLNDEYLSDVSKQFVLDMLQIDCKHLPSNFDEDAYIYVNEFIPNCIEKEEPKKKPKKEPKKEPKGLSPSEEMEMMGQEDISFHSRKLKELQSIQDFFYSTKKVKLDQKLNDLILSLNRHADFFPTPPDVSEYIYKRVLDAYGSDSIYVLDMCAGLASLSLPFIENIRSQDKVYLEELSLDFYNFIEPLQTSQIKVNHGNSLDETWTSGKGINTIVCNPPYSISFMHKGKMHMDFKQGYLFFLYKACKILSELTYTGELYFICPTTYFKDGEFKIPKKTKKMIEEYFNDTLEDDEDWYHQAELVKEITNFKTFDKYGKPKLFKATFGLFHIIPLKSQYKQKELVPVSLDEPTLQEIVAQRKAEPIVSLDQAPTLKQRKLKARVQEAKKQGESTSLDKLATLKQRKFFGKAKQVRGEARTIQLEEPDMPEPVSRKLVRKPVAPRKIQLEEPDEPVPVPAPVRRVRRRRVAPASSLDLIRGKVFAYFDDYNPEETGLSKGQIKSHLKELGVELKSGELEKLYAEYISDKTPVPIQRPLIELVAEYIHSGQKLTQVALLSELAKQIKMTKAMKDEAKQILKVYKKERITRRNECRRKPKEECIQSESCQYVEGTKRQYCRKKRQRFVSAPITPIAPTRPETPDVAYFEMRQGGSLTGRQTKKFVEASYSKKKKAQTVGNYVLDKSLSSKKNKVYVDPKGDVVIANAGTSSASDWANNARIGTDYKKTKRYKDIEKTQRKAIAKYGIENITNVAHSQSGHAVNLLAKKGLTKEAIAVNPALLGTKANRNVDVVRSSGDVVSAFAKGKQKTVKATSFNPLTEHSASKILPDNAIYGKSYLDK